MKKTSLLILTLTMTLLLIASVSLARGRYRSCNYSSNYCMGGGGGRFCAQPARMQSQRLYDPKTVESISGEIAGIEKIDGRGRSGGMHVMVKTGSETIPVHLGPQWFLSQKDAQLAVNDKIEIKGSRIQYDGKPTIIAAEITSGGKTIKLRNADGVPDWAGQRKRN
jgi:hypothetical protein